jgi:hypothetical protein
MFNSTVGQGCIMQDSTHSSILNSASQSTYDSGLDTSFWIHLQHSLVNLGVKAHRLIQLPGRLQKDISPTEDPATKRSGKVTLNRPFRADLDGVLSFSFGLAGLVALGFLFTTIIPPLASGIIAFLFSLSAIIFGVRSLRKVDAHALNVIGLILGISALSTILVGGLIILLDSCFIFCPNR